MRDRDPVLKEIGARLQAIRKNLGLLQKEFAGELGISTSSLSDIEAGNMKLRFELIYHITRKYNINIYYLLHGEGEMYMQETSEVAALVVKKPEFTEWLTDFLWYFNESPMVRYTMMSYFLTYKNQSDQLIKKDIENNKKKKGEKND